jgi:hypothetical protein
VNDAVRDFDLSRGDATYIACNFILQHALEGDWLWNSSRSIDLRAFAVVLAANFLSNAK